MRYRGVKDFLVGVFGEAEAERMLAEGYEMLRLDRKVWSLEADIAMMAWESTLPDEFTPARCGHLLPKGAFVFDVLDNRQLEDLIPEGDA
jgi:hypothetical protein